MAENEKVPPRQNPEPQAKRTGREGPDPESLPGEYSEDMIVNRFTPPPEPGEEDQEEEES